MSWDELKKELSREVKATIAKLDKLTNKQISEVLEDFLVYYNIEKTKKSNERKIFVDKYGGHIVIIRFPKKSLLEKVKKVENFTPSVAQNNSIRWYGATMPLFNDNPITMFLSEDFFPEMKGEKTTFKDFWEPEDKTRLFIIRGKDTEEYKWLDEEKDRTIYGRKENDFIKEAQERYQDQEINTIDDIPKGTLGSIKHTFNAEQYLKVI